ncbi:MAG: hypothetical protein AAGA32_00820 [Pseudomonadota bacterium]
MARVGILPLGRPTFDVPFAEEGLAAMLARLDETEHEIVGPRRLLFDGEAAEAALDELEAEQIDRLLVLQVTFTDAGVVALAAERFSEPLEIWALPEPRLGGRLRLNAFCGLNLASHALGLRGRGFGWLFAAPEGADVAGLLSGARAVGQVDPVPADAPADPRFAGALRGRRIGRVGAHPDGFDTCAYDPAALHALAGVEVAEIDLPDLFSAAHAATAEATAALRHEAAGSVAELDAVDPDELDRSLRLKLALDDLRAARGVDAFAIRCWPETFTEYGGAVCGPVSMMGTARIPCACEADVYGAVTQLLLQEVAGASVFLVDLVDVDIADDTAVVWHCGQAPAEMAAEPPRATIHTNRRMPLLYEFRLKPGPVTVTRISQARGRASLVIAEAEVLDRPMAFTGTSGVVRFAKPAADVLDAVIASGLEHHVALAYGHHGHDLRAAAAALDLPVLELS